jgi:protein TonB
MTPERWVGIGFVAVLHVIVIWAIVSGLATKIVKAVVPPDLVVDVTPTHLEDPPPPPKMPDVKVDAQPNTVVQPVIDIAPDLPGPTAKPQPPQTQPQQVANIAPDTAAAGVMSTHTIPPYPSLAIRLQEQGNVKLSLQISAQGVVTAAQVVQSSGFPDLDQSAVSWVMGHWRYKPAMQSGQPVASTAMAVVVFNLKNAR